MRGGLRAQKARFGRQLDYALPGDAVEGSLRDRGSDELAATHDEKVLDCAFGHPSLTVEQNSLVGGCVAGLDAGEDVVQIVEALGPWIEPVAGEPARGDDDQPSPLLPHRSTSARYKNPAQTPGGIAASACGAVTHAGRTMAGNESTRAQQITLPPPMALAS